MKTKIALCQIKPIFNEPKTNFDKMEEIINKYSKEDVQLFIFPEDFLYGILRNGDQFSKALKNTDTWISKFKLLARKYNVDLIPGSFPISEDNKLLNTTVYINKTGEIINKYSKTNLWLSERAKYTPNTKPIKCFNSVLGKTVQIICWDLMNHKIFEEAIRQNAEWIINISLWYTNQTRSLKRTRGKTKNKYHIPVRSSERLDSIIETRSTEYDVGIIFCNIGGKHQYLDEDGLFQHANSAGNTQAIAPLDVVRKIVKGRAEEILICDIPDIKDGIADHEILWGRREDIKNNYPWNKSPNTVLG